MKKYLYKPKHPLFQFLIFGLIGGLGVLVNVGLNTLFIITFLKGHELIANILSTALTIIFNWIGNRILTFDGGKKAHTEAIQFFIVSMMALPLNALSLYITRDILGYTSVMASNLSIIAATAIGMIFKFLLYKLWVFSPQSNS